MIRGESGKVPDKKSWEIYRKTIDELGIQLTLDGLLQKRGLIPPLDL
jgi:hypothetical protein